MWRARRALLPRVTCLDLSCSPQTVDQKVGILLLMALFRMVPNIRELDSSYIGFFRLSYFFIRPQTLLRVDCRGADDCLDLLGNDVFFLQEFYLDDSRLRVPHLPDAAPDEIAMSFTSPNHADTNYHMLMYCSGLERLSIKNVSWSSRFGPMDDGIFPVTQEMIIKFVRRTPTLRWLRSDLTAENIAMLKQERPQVTFVTD